MSFLNKIFDFIKGLATRAGLNTFLKKYQKLAIEQIEKLAETNSGKPFDEWWDEAFAAVKAELQKDGATFKDNWVAIALNLAYEVFKADKEA
jgi:hypothetical protein